MNNFSSSAKSSTNSQSEINTASSDSNILAKIKRLRIEENLLIQSLKRTSTIHHSENDNVVQCPNVSEFKSFTSKLKDTYNDVKNMFEEVKASTDSEEALQSIDIKDIKMNVLELEEKIKTLKNYLHTELTSLKQVEQQLNKQLFDSPKDNNEIRRQPKVHTTTYNEIVPSPVRVLMNSPFKCLDVQHFQEFMANSPNRFGGWNEYHHNIFVKFWKKYFQIDNETDFEYLVTNVEYSKSFHVFTRELLEKLQGIQIDDIISHHKWYSKYSYLKERQQAAIDKWKSNKKILNKSLHKPQKNNKFERKTEKWCKSSVNDSGIRDDAKMPREKPFKALASNSCCDYGYDEEASVLYHPNTNEEKRETITQSEQDAEIVPRADVNHTKIPKTRTMFDHVKPTEQWINRCNTVDNSLKTINHLEYIKKLRTPNWRIGL